jgi:hypothetical protein
LVVALLVAEPENVKVPVASDDPGVLPLERVITLLAVAPPRVAANIAAERRGAVALPSVEPLETAMLPEGPAARKRWRSPAMVLLMFITPPPKPSPVPKPSNGRTSGTEGDTGGEGVIDSGSRNVAEVVSVLSPLATRPRPDSLMVPESVALCPLTEVKS